MSITTALTERWDADHIALIDDQGPLTYGELEERIGKTRTWLAQRGVAPGDVLAVQLPKSRAALELFLATVSIGAVFLPINHRATTAEADALSTDSNAVLTVRIAPRLAGLRPLPASEVDRDSEAVRLYTSGTTGRPKGARLSHNNVLATVRALHEAWGWRRDDVLLHCLPMHHVHGLFVAQLGALYAGARTEWHDGFDAAAVLRDLPDATVFMGVPTFYHRLLQQPELEQTDLSAMRLFTSGSAPLPAHEHSAFAERTGHRIVERYGMTEVGIVLSNPLDGERRPGRVGLPLPGVRVRVVEPGTVAQVDDGVVGMLHIKGPSVFLGYHERPEATAAALLDGGWMRTGDLVERDDTGSHRIVGRLDDLVLTGGFNVYPSEVEQALTQLPGVDEALVYGVSDDDLGMALHAQFIGEASPDDLREALRGTLSGYKVPRAFHSVSELPRNAMGKLVRPRGGIDPLA